VYSPEGDRNPIETGVEANRGTTPIAEPTVYRFASDFWDRAGYSIDALPTNQDGRLAEGQGYEIFEIFLKTNGIAAATTAIWVVALLSVVVNSSNLLLRAGLVAVVIGVCGLWAWMVSDNWKGCASGQVDSFCGDLTKFHDWEPEGPDLHGLRNGSLVFKVSSEAYDALPETAHYRIFFEPRTRDVVNIDEHSDDAPHGILATPRARAVGRPSPST
jgi:hypothetical protein